ncbi:MAG TPA: sulfite exporter TauE/SafE family protein [Burkholderiales bacterium]|nr:sulfite exporter TauE/SafE family protein [Burkholderiales bacterium]
MTELGIASVFLVGFLGGVHCAGMCGGIVGALSIHLPAKSATWRYHIAYNAGRIASYAAMGVIAGAIGESSILFMHNLVPVQKSLYVLANLMLVAMGLYLAGISRGVLFLERAGSVAWRYLQPFSHRLFPVNSLPRALLLGGLWGWIPCGLVYSVLFVSLASGSAANGGLLMLAFGLGTLPNLLAMGLFAHRLLPPMQNQILRLAVGIVIAGFGVIGLLHIEHVEHIHQLHFIGNHV